MAILHCLKTEPYEALALATRLNDSFAIGDGHWNYASYYNQLQVFDSAYHHFDTANKYFDKSGHMPMNRQKWSMAWRLSKGVLKIILAAKC